ncbi:MAG: phage holin family protein [Nocardioides sp.]
MTSNAPSTRPAHRRPDVPSAEDPTIGRLVADATRDISSIVHNEIALAKSELKVSIKNGGTGAGLFGGAAFLAVLAVIMLSVAFAYFLSMTGLHLAWCFLIVFGVYVLIAGAMAFLGVKKVKKVRAPERAIQQAQKTKTLLKRG